MAFLHPILGFRRFTPVDAIKKDIAAQLFADRHEHISTTGYLLLFSTTRQQTWLIASNHRLFCILDDVAGDGFVTRWELTKHTIIHNGKIILDIRIHEDYSSRSGSIDFGEMHKNWLYSKKIFPQTELLFNAFHDFIFLHCGW